MKKIKEFLFLFVPLIVLTILPIILFLTNLPTSAFVGYSNYLRLFLNDSIFWKAIFYTYYKPFVFSIITVTCVALLCHLIKCLKLRKVFYPASIVLASLVSFVSIYINKANYLGLPMDAYNSQSLLSNSPPPISISVYEILLALQIGFLIAFLFWLAETLFQFIKNRKTA